MTQDTHNPAHAEGGVHILTALHAVSTRLSLTDAERRRVDCPDGGVLEPGALWGHSCALFLEADQAGQGSQFDLGCAPLVLDWLGFADDVAFRAAFGCTPSESLEALVGTLRPLAHLVETLDPSAPVGARYALARVWCRRVRLLADARPRPLAATLEAVERALACPPETDEIVRALLHCKAELAHLLSADETERTARAAIEEVERHAGGEDFDALVHATTARVACFWWMAAHGTGLLASEREGVDVAPGGERLWEAICRALRERRWDAVPIALPSAPLHRNWSDQWVDPAVYGECMRASAASGLLDKILHMVDALLRGGPLPDSLGPAASTVVSVLLERRAALEADWVPGRAEPERIWYELHQGAQRPDTIERLELIRGLHPVLARIGSVVPFGPVAVYLDRAAESEARGDYADERAALQAGIELSEAVPDLDQREHATVRLGLLAWREAKLTEVARLLGPLRGRQAVELRERIDGAEPERLALHQARESLRRRTDAVRGGRYAWAHADAGHTVRALEVGQALCDQFPARGVPEALLGGLLLEQARCRDAVPVLTSALQLGFDATLGEALLAQAASRAGGDGAAELRLEILWARERGLAVGLSGREVLALEDQSGTES